MEITLALFFYLYLALVGVFLLFAFFVLYHLIKFGFRGAGVFFLIMAFIIGAGLILFFSWQALAVIDWTEPLNFFLFDNNFNNL